MPLDFPNAPTTGQIYLYGDRKWVYDGTGWRSSSGASSLSLSSTGDLTTLGSVSDYAGNVRRIIHKEATSAYTLVALDRGKFIDITTGGVTVPSGIFSVGDAVSIYNDSSLSQIITQGASVTMYLGGTSTTGNRTLAQRGICTVLCVSANTFVISGAGLT